LSADPDGEPGQLDPSRGDLENAGMSKREIDDYLRGLDEPKRSTLEHLRDTIVAIVPNAEQGISYGVPAFRLKGKTIAGFAAFANHLSYLPHSGRVIGHLAKDTEPYTKTKSTTTRDDREEAIGRPHHRSIQNTAITGYPNDHPPRICRRAPTSRRLSGCLSSRPVTSDR
jgi:uncharacterized protein YdhG (YjbR/CyaY superfamily)